MDSYTTIGYRSVNSEFLQERP